MNVTPTFNDVKRSCINFEQNSLFTYHKTDRIVPYGHTVAIDSFS